MLLVLLFLGLLEIASAIPERYEQVQEWSMWKGHHQKSYDTELLEMERHAIWLANKKYIDHHNANANLFGYTLAMNGFGDMVSMH